MCGHFFDHGIGKVLAQVAPIAAAFIPGVGPLASAALAAGTSALSTKLQGGSWGQALKSGALSGLGSAAMPMLGNAFQSIAPETAGALGITGGYKTVFGDSFGSGLGQTLGMGGADAAGAAAGSLQGPSGGTSGLTQAAMSNPSVDMQSPSAVGAQTMASSYPQLAGVTGTDAPGSVLGKAGEWASSHAIPLVMGAATLYSGLKTAQDRTKQQEQAQAATAAKNAQDLANWKLTLNTPPLNRQQTPGNSDIDYNRYGFGPERQFLTNNQTSPGTPPVAMARGGSVRSDDGEPDMDPIPDPPSMRRMRNGSANYEDYKQYNREMAVRKKPTPQTDGEPDMDPIGKAAGGKMRALRMKAGGFPKKNGKISGPGGPTGDKIRAMLSDGEYVVKAKSVSHLGRGNNNKGAKILDKLNNAPADRLKALGKKIHKLGVA